MRKVGANAPAVRPAASRAIVGSLPASVGPYAADDMGLSMYASPPDVEVTVREFEEFTRDRLRVLHVFDRLCTYETRLEGMSDLRPKVGKELVETGLQLDYPTGSNIDTFMARKADFSRRDNISHFALRLAFCKTREAREWFVRQESRLFSLRFESLRPEAQEAYIARSDLKCRKFDPSAVGPDERVNLHDVRMATPAAKIWRSESKNPEYDSTFYTMPFQEVDPRLIAGRKVVVIKGVAYIPSVALKTILAKRFKDSLWQSMEVAFQGLPTALADPRIGGFLRDLQDYGMQLLVAQKKPGSEDVGEVLTHDNFEEMLVRSFPPCMRRQVEKQREMKKHLKHAGRLQLRPFLKECGFTFEDSHRWWKQELCKDPQIDAASYDKNYAYDIDHAYGKKGHLQGQNCFGCPKVIGFPAESAGQVHGCPFKVLEIPALRQQLHRWKVSEAQMVEIEKLINNGKHFQLACIEYFKALHPGSEGDGVGNSPGDFFRESCRHYQQKAEKEKASATAKTAGA